MTAIPQSAIALRDAIRLGELSAREAVAHFIARIENRRDLGAFITVTAEQALEAAAAADARFAALAPANRGSLPELHGMPLAHKDLVDVTGAPTTFGTAAMPAVVAERDHPGVAVLRAAGTISLGKTQVPELGLNAYSENLIAPPARNPHDPSRTPGGSSGGSAAAVTAGLLPFAPGSDGGGSVRIPALACGLVGLKPGLGALRTDVTDGTSDAFGAPRLVVSGPLAHTAAEAALLFDAMRGPDAAAAQHSPTARARSSRGGRDRTPALTAVREADALTGLRIGMSAASPFEAAHPTPLSPDSVLAWETAAQRLGARGHRVEAAAFDYDERYPEVFTSCWMAGLSLLELPGEAATSLTAFTREFRERALATPREQHLAAAAALREIAAGLRTQWGEYDVVLTPGLAALPPHIGSFLAMSPTDDYRAQCEWTPFTSMVNVSGLPAIAVPILTVENGLTMGAQLIGRAGSEHQLLQLAAQLTQP